jgi:hypothetical protein
MNRSRSHTWYTLSYQDQPPTPVGVTRTAEAPGSRQAQR